MKLLVGLGNPGPQYQFTRHNLGFLALDLLAERAGISLDVSKFEGHLGEGEVCGEKVILCKPLTFMNLSGRCVQRVKNFYKLPDDDLVIIQDDIDMPFPKVKNRMNGGDGGHNGIRSIHKELGVKDFWRIKVGIGRPENAGGVHGWVLGRFEDSELQQLPQVVDEISDRLHGMWR